MSDADAADSDQLAPTSSSTTAHLSDIFVDSYVRYRNGKEETVDAYWRRSRVDRPPLTPESKAKLLKILADEQKANEKKITDDTNAFAKAKEAGDEAGMKTANDDLAVRLQVRSGLSDRVHSLQ